VLLTRARAQRRVLEGVEDDRGHVDGRQAGQEALILLILTSACRKPEAVSIGVDGDIDEVRVVKRRCRPLEICLEDRARRRPLAPELGRQFASIAGKPSPAALAMEVVLGSARRDRSRPAVRNEVSLWTRTGSGRSRADKGRQRARPRTRGRPRPPQRRGGHRGTHAAVRPANPRWAPPSRYRRPAGRYALRHG
jgi:hypothetical protein